MRLGPSDSSVDLAAIVGVLVDPFGQRLEFVKQPLRAGFGGEASRDDSLRIEECFGPVELAPEVVPHGAKPPRMEATGETGAGWHLNTQREALPLGSRARREP